MFQNPTYNNNFYFNFKLVHENATTNIEWSALKASISYAWEVEG